MRGEVNHIPLLDTYPSCGEETRGEEEQYTRSHVGLSQHLRAAQRSHIVTLNTTFTLPVLTGVKQSIYACGEKLI